MVKAIFTLPNGTSVSIDGTPEEVKDLLAFYAEDKKTGKPVTSPHKITEPKPEEKNPIEKKIKPDNTDIEKIVETVKTCPEAESIEKYILDKTNEANRVLIPLYAIHEYFNDAFGLTTTEISKVTTGLGVRVSRQNSLRGANNVQGFVVKFGNPPRYQINRRGITHIKAVLSGTQTTDLDSQAPKKRKTTRNDTGPKALILELKNNGYFSEKRSITDVQKRLEELGHIYAQTSLSTPLKRLVIARQLTRVKDKENDIWRYSAS
jgi:hypothetical protein